jgi:hypothetical protein
VSTSVTGKNVQSGFVEGSFIGSQAENIAGAYSVDTIENRTVTDVFLGTRGLN